MTRRDQRRNDDTTDEEGDAAVKNGQTSNQQKPITKSRQMEAYESEESEEEDPSNEVIEIDSDDSQDGLDTSHNNDQSSKNEQNNNQDSDRESTSSDIVVVSDDYQKFNEEIERLSKINTEVELNSEDKVSIRNFKIHKLLGTGAYGKVFLVEKLDGLDKGQLYAMKVLEKNKVTQKKKTTEHTRTEREVLEKVISCPFLATLYYAFQTAEKLYLVMEFVQGGELFSHLYRSEHFGEDQVRFYIAEIIVALEQLHRLNIIYRDIKLENILLDADGHIIITDFGLSKELTDNARAMSYCGTIEYMAPEIVNPNGIGHDLNVDWWSVGVLIIELLSGQSPFSREGEDSNQQLISERIQRQAPNIPTTIGKDAKDLILKLLEKDPTKRLGYRRDADELKKHKFFRGIKWDILTEKRYNAPMKPTLKNKFDVSQFSEDFTTQPAEDGPAESGKLTAPNGKNFFKSYSFVAPKLRSKKEQSDVKLKLDEMNITGSPPEMNRPSLKEVLKVHKRNKSAFFEKYEFVEDKLPIGDGTYSLCMKCRSIQTHEEFAVKILKLDHDASLEIEALKKCQNHKNIVKMVETIQDKRFNYIIFELLSGGELFSRIRDRGSLAENTAHSYFKQIVEAVIFMHSKGIIHKDLKPENILFVDSSVDSELRIVDFGFAQKISSEESPPCFTLDYAAPESLVRCETKPSRDLWSLGVILYTMLCGNTPFKPLSNNVNDQDERNFRMQITENIRNGLFNKDNIRWSQSSIEARDLIIQLIRVNESERISLDEVLHHPWMLTNFENQSYNASLHRTGSEDDAIVINDDDFRNENRDETRSTGDSSSGIVMSDRNEGSSVSHEDEMVMPIIEEQIEPENLSLKSNGKIEEKLLEDEPTITAPSKEISLQEENHEEVSPAIPKTLTSKLRTPIKLRSRASQKAKKTPQMLKSSPLDLHMPKNQTVATGLPLNLVVESEEKFKGFDVMESENDNNFPCFGFSCDSKPDIMSTAVLLYFELFNGMRSNEQEKTSSNQVLSVEIPRRGRKKKIVNTRNVVEPTKVEAAAKMKTMRSSKVQQKEQIVPKQQVTAILENVNVPQNSSRPVRTCQALQKAQKFAEIQKLQTKKDEKKSTQRTRAPKRPINEHELVTVTKKARKTVKIEQIKKEAVNTVTIEVKQPYARTKKNNGEKVETRGRKRKIKVEPSAAFEGKILKVATLEEEDKEVSLKNVRTTRIRRQKDKKTAVIPVTDRLALNLNIKKEERSAIDISYLQRPAQNLSPKFKQRLNSVRTCYVDNKLQPSIIPSRFTKPEPMEKSAINIFPLKLRNQY